MAGCLQVMRAVLRAREHTDPAGWKQAQRQIQEAKLQRQRLQRETEDLEAALERSYREGRLHPEGAWAQHALLVRPEGAWAQHALPV